MSELDPQITSMLDRLQPRVVDERRGWAQILADAELTPDRATPSRRIGRRLLLALAVVALAALIAVPALAFNGWWVFGSSAPTPAGGVSVVKTGTLKGVSWKLTSYLSAGAGVCVQFTPDPGQGAHAAAGCGLDVRGEPNLKSATKGHAVGYLRTINSPQVPDFVFGATARDVIEVEAIFNNGQAVIAPTVPAPGAIQAPLRFYVMALPHCASLTALVARGQGGGLLEKQPLEAGPLQMRACSEG
jgi:hypothetical protein